MTKTPPSQPQTPPVKAPNKEYFPRTKALPAQSPLFWVQQKDRYLRQTLIRDIEEITSRRLVLYYGNRFKGAMIDSGDIAYLTELLGDIGNDPVDLLLETVGGQTDATEALVSTLRNTVSDFRVIVARSAKSNGTLLALAASEIVMGAASELGPIEPLVNGIPCSILIQPAMAQTNYPLHMFGQFALQQSKTLARQLLEKGMMQGKDATRIDQVVQALSSRDTYYSHGSVIDHKEATSLDLKVKYLAPDDELWQRIWLLSCMIEYDCQKSNYLKLFEGRMRSTAVSAPTNNAATP